MVFRIPQRDAIGVEHSEMSEAEYLALRRANADSKWTTQLCQQ